MFGPALGPTTRLKRNERKKMGLTFSPTRKIFDLENKDLPGKQVCM